MATYNGERYIKKQIDSIICQLSDNDEIIISDDGSTDNTIDIIKTYQDKRIKLFYHKRDNGILKEKAAAFILAAKNFENSLNHARGDFIFLSDQDDIWEIDRVREIVTALSYSDLVLCNFSIINDRDEIVNDKYLNKDPVRKSYLKNLAKNPFMGCTMAFSKKVLSFCLPFPKKVIGHDLWIGFIVFVLKRRFMFIERPLHRYRQHNLNVSPTTGKSKNGLFFKILYRIIFSFEIFSRVFEVKMRKYL